MHVGFQLGLLGGVIIAVASSFLLFSNGKVCGISGILAQVFSSTPHHILWRAFFVVGLIFGAAVMLYLRPQLFTYAFNPSWAKLLIAGFLVGFGTRYGSGCTSGHGVCGIARFSKRSILATATFIAFGALTILIERVLN